MGSWSTALNQTFLPFHSRMICCGISSLISLALATITNPPTHIRRHNVPVIRGHGSPVYLSGPVTAFFMTTRGFDQAGMIDGIISERIHPRKCLNSGFGLSKMTRRSRMAKPRVDTSLVIERRLHAYRYAVERRTHIVKDVSLKSRSCDPRLSRRRFSVGIGRKLLHVLYRS